MGQCDSNKTVEMETMMYHFFAMHENIYENHIEIIGQDVNHIKNVLRMKVGDKLRISSGDNIDYICCISAINEDKIKADICSIDKMGNELPIKVYLFQGLPKQEKMEWIIQKMTELGVYAIIPVSMKRCVVKFDDKKAKSKVERWNSIAESAAKQSNRSIVPQIHNIMPFKEALTYVKDLDSKLLPYECAEGIKKTRNRVNQLTTGQSVGIFIGPEGGYDLSELELAKKHGWESITLGKRILRTETAAMMLMSILMYNMEED